MNYDSSVDHLKLEVLAIQMASKIWLSFLNNQYFYKTLSSFCLFFQLDSSVGSNRLDFYIFAILIVNHHWRKVFTFI